MKSIEVETYGRIYKSIGEAARAHGVIPSTAYSRRRRGWGLIAAVTYPVQCRVGSLYNKLHFSRVQEYNRKHRKQIVNV